MTKFERMREDVEELLDVLSSEPQGKIIVCNILASIEECLLDPDTVKFFLECCAQRYQNEKNEKRKKCANLNLEDIIRIFEEVAVGHHYHCNLEDNFLLKCKQSPYNGDVINIISYEKFTECVNPEFVSAGHNFSHLNYDPRDPGIKEAIESLSGKSSCFKDDASLGGNPQRPFFWITPAKEVGGISSANEIRDLLGLIHYNTNTALIKISIKSKDIKNRRQARPTFIEGVGHRRFKVKHGDSKSPEWGYTVHLEKLASEEPDIDGARERVVEPVPFKALKSFRIEYMGEISNSRGETSQDNDEAFAKQICEKDIIKIIDELIFYLYERRS